MTGTVTRASTRSNAVKLGFKEVIVDGVSVFVLNRKMDYPDSMGILEVVNLKPFRHDELLSILNTENKLRKELENGWFWLEGEGINKKFDLYTIDVRANVDDPDNTVCVWNGTYPLSFAVLNDADAYRFGWRFGLYANSGPTAVALLVVGKFVPEPQAQQNTIKQIVWSMISKHLPIGASDVGVRKVTEETFQSVAAKLGFEGMTIDGGSLFVRNDGANRRDTVRIIEEAGLVLFTYPEILRILGTDETFRERLKDKWFWLEGKGIHKEKELYAIGEKGELFERKESELIENTIRIGNGNGPLSLLVNSDRDAVNYGRRYDLLAEDEIGVAPVIVGMRPKPIRQVEQFMRT
jgi:hypothetical protein